MTVIKFVRNNQKVCRFEERRRKPRICYPIPIKVRGMEDDGRRFEFDTVAEDISSGGISARTKQECRRGQKLFIVARFSLAKERMLQGPSIAAHATVLRTGKHPDGTFDFAAVFNRYRML